MFIFLQRRVTQLC